MKIVTLFYKRINLHVPPINMWEKKTRWMMKERGKKRMKESRKVSCFLFLFDNKGHFRKIECFISFFSICKLSLGVGLKYGTYEDLLLIFGPSWAQNTILPKIYMEGQKCEKSSPPHSYLVFGDPSQFYRWNIICTWYRFKKSYKLPIILYKVSS